ncbi:MULTISPECIES: DUF2777 family protein [Bacillus]|uniref:DUF2777 domain-containing protein n=2 Tax=Bacillus TaxID=1386 RepID=A0A0M4FEN5_9BACI|nr:MULTISPECIES: DUF2777 family protein [Bacillus]ALC80687.1 hypothetical protein AM592_03105 [Bacillus gobiensis]MBP1079578.1 hypothetical protein [Bacillus capparidis]MED1094979.1 DUF2777 family protein [Bacillus capparidis]
MLTEERKKRISLEAGSCAIGYIMIEDGHCLIEDETGDLFLPESINGLIWMNTGAAWAEGTLCGSKHEFQMKDKIIKLKGGEEISYPLNLFKPLEELLEQLNDRQFELLLRELNRLGFSLFDCVYSFHPLSYSSLKKESDFSGAGFFQFANDISHCSLQHHFKRGEFTSDRFEFTLSSGERSLLMEAEQK